MISLIVVLRFPLRPIMHPWQHWIHLRHSQPITITFHSSRVVHFQTLDTPETSSNHHNYISLCYIIFIFLYYILYYFKSLFLTIDCKTCNGYLIWYQITFATSNSFHNLNFDCCWVLPASDIDMSFSAVPELYGKNIHFTEYLYKCTFCLDVVFSDDSSKFLWIWIISGFAGK